MVTDPETVGACGKALRMRTVQIEGVERLALALSRRRRATALLTTAQVVTHRHTSVVRHYVIQRTVVNV